MKKYFYLLALVSIIFIAGCSDDSGTETPVGGAVDCGTSVASLPFGDELTEDDALECFGEQIKNNCNPAKVMLPSQDGSLLNLELKGNLFTTCDFEITFPSADQMTDESIKHLGGKDITCTLDFDKLSENLSPTRVDHPESLTNLGVSWTMLMAATRNSDCSGSVINAA